MHNRIKSLREDLNLSQEAFGAKIGLTRSGVSNIENGQRSVSERHIKLLVSAFHVSEQWLRTGEGEMYEKVPADLVDQLAQEHHLGIGGRALLKAMTRAFLELDEPTQERLFQTVWNIMQNELLDSGPTDEEFFGTDASSSDGNELSS